MRFICSRKIATIALFSLVITILGSSSLLATVGGHSHGQGRGGLSDIPLNIGAAFDITQEIRSEDDNEFELRALELNIGAPVDPYFDALATIAWHEGEFELEEAWVSAVLPYSFKVQFGREFLPFGYLNRVHEHDFPQVDQPFVIEELTTDHGFIGDGAHLEWMAPFFNPTLTVNVGLYDNVQHSVGRRIEGRPAVARLQSYWESKDGTHAMLGGLSYLTGIGNQDLLAGRLDAGDTGNMGADRGRAQGYIQSVAGADIKYRWRPAGRTYRGLTVGAEYLTVDYDPNEFFDAVTSDSPSISDDGFYTYAQWDFDRFWGVGYRYDDSDVLFSEYTDDARMTAHSVYAEWRATEFSRLRLQYQRRDDERSEDEENLVMLQGTYFLGWHPPHRF